MAREIKTLIWCDVHLNRDGEYVEAQELPPVTMGNLKPRVLALCEPCTKEVYEPLRQVLTEHGQLVPQDVTGTRFPGTSPGSGVWPCPDPGCHKHANPFKHEQSLRNHAKQVHSLPINELRVKHSQAGDATLDVEVAAQPAVTKAECDLCDKVYTWPEVRQPNTALGVHKAKAHGISGAKKHAKKAG